MREDKHPCHVHFLQDGEEGRNAPQSQRSRAFASQRRRQSASLNVRKLLSSTPGADEEADVTDEEGEEARPRGTQGGASAGVGSDEEGEQQESSESRGHDDAATMRACGTAAGSMVARGSLDGTLPASRAHSPAPSHQAKGRRSAMQVCGAGHGGL